jgi:hypothetical protein
MPNWQVLTSIDSIIRHEFPFRFGSLRLGVGTKITQKKNWQFCHIPVYSVELIVSIPPQEAEARHEKD